MNKYLANLINEATARRHFAVSLSDNIVIPEITRDQVVFALQTVLPGLVKPAIEARFYWRSAQRVVIGGMPPFVQEERGQLKIRPLAASLAEYRGFWEWVLLGTLETGGNLVLVLPSTDFPFELSAKVWDATVYSNLSALVPRAAIAFAKRRTQNKDLIACIFFNSSTQIGFAIVSGEAQSGKLFLHFAKRCQYRDKQEALRREVVP